jgi:LysM repeat protein
MGLFDLFGKSFSAQVQDAVGKISASGLDVRGLRADVDGKVVTLRGHAKDLAVKTRVMEEFNKLVDTDNTLNLIEVDEKPAPPPEPVEQPVEAETIHEVIAGDTLSGIAKTHYGNANLYMKIFEANRDILDDPNLIKVGQKLRIPPK